MRISFTATRSLSEAGKNIIFERLCQLEDVDAFVTGGAIGGDEFIHRTMRELYPDAHFAMILPKVPGSMSLVSDAETDIAHGARGTVVWTGLEPLKRNHIILRRGDCLEAFPSDSHERMRGSGTWATIRYARAAKMPATITPLS